MLTRKQYELLAFIDDRLQARGVPPSYDEMKVALGLRSKSGIHRLISALEERGFLRRLPHRARALEVLRRPDGSAPAGGETPAGGFTATVIDGGFTGRDPLPSAEVTETPADAVSLPLLGRIAAGTPIEALRDVDNHVEVPAGLVRGGEHYALEVEGDSMRDAGILDGDTAVVRACETADTGVIVVALVDEQEVTLKRLRHRGGAVALEPANPDYETRVFPRDRVRIQGRLAALLRRYE